MLTCADSNFQWLLEYELRASARNRRFLSLVGVDSDRKPEEVQRVLEGTIREGDVVFSLDDTTVLLMGETERAGAHRAIERFTDVLDGEMEVRFAVSSYPADGKTPEDLMQAMAAGFDTATPAQEGATA